MNKLLKLKHAVIIFITLLATATSFAQNWETSNYFIEFKIKNAKLNVTGTFGGLTSKIIFDPNKTLGNSIEAKIDVKTIKTGINMRDNHLKKAEYFDATKFPDITIKSKNIKKEKDNLFLAKCELIVKGKSKEIDLPFTFTETGNRADFVGNLTLNRLDFGVGSASVLMANNVVVTIKVFAVKLN